MDYNYIIMSCDIFESNISYHYLYSLYIIWFVWIIHHIKQLYTIQYMLHLNIVKQMTTTEYYTVWLQSDYIV